MMRFLHHWSCIHDILIYKQHWLCINIRTALEWYIFFRIETKPSILICVLIASNVSCNLVFQFERIVPFEHVFDPCGILINISWYYISSNKNYNNSSTPFRILRCLPPAPSRPLGKDVWPAFHAHPQWNNRTGKPYFFGFPAFDAIIATYTKMPDWNSAELLFGILPMPYTFVFFSICSQIWFDLFYFYNAITFISTLIPSFLQSFFSHRNNHQRKHGL